MSGTIEPPTRIPFGPFEADLPSQELKKHGVRLRLPRQSFQILKMLLERPGEVVTRQELRVKLWAVDTFVDFDHGLNAAVKRLRDALGDTAEDPKYIETLPRIGYRFIATGVPDTAPPEENHPSLKQEKSYTSRKQWSWLIGAAAVLPGQWYWITAAVGVFVLLSAILVWLHVRNTRESMSPSVEVVPLLSTAGGQGAPAFSPDGRQVAFAYFGGHPGIYTTLVGGGKPLQLTEGVADGDPTWSPDGQQIAFARYSSAHNQRSIYVIPALGGSERRVYTGAFPKWAQCNRMDWSPDGKSLTFTESADEAEAHVALVSLSDLAVHPLTFPGNQVFDCDPTFSPDGSEVAFVRGTMGAWLGDLFLLKVAGGEPIRLTSGNSGGVPAWTQDGSEIVFSSPMNGVRTLWRISASGGMPRRVPGAGGDAWDPSISRRGNQLAYWVWKQWDTVWRLNLRDDHHPLGPPAQLLSGRSVVWKPNFSPDGKKIVFESDRSGYGEIWVCDSDGTNCTELTTLHAESGTPRWSPDGHHITFESIAQHFYEVYVIDVPGGTPRLVPTFPEGNNGTPNWSRDGQWIYFYSAHEKGPYQLWKVPFKGGTPVRVTKNGGVYAIESQDGHFVFYAKLNQPGLWKMPLTGGEETRVMEQPTNWAFWALAPNGIYYLNESIPPHGRIEFFDFANGQSMAVLALDKSSSLFGGLALSPDGKSLLFGQNELNESYIMLMKNFR